MFTAILSKNKGIHIINFRFGNGTYKTMCGKNFSTNSRINTLSFDNTFNGLCKKCKFFYDDMYSSDLEDYPEISRSITQQRFSSLLFFHRNESLGPKLKFENLTYRFWKKFLKYQRLVNTNKHHA